MKLDKLLARPVGQTAVGEVLSAIRRAGTQVHGAFDGSMLRDEGYHFSRAGTFIERADSTARILDMKYFLLLPSLSYVGSSLDTGQWEQVLRSVAGARVYSWLNAGQIEARGIVEFLVLDDRFPRSLAFCRSALRENLAALARMHGVEGRCNALMRDADTRISHLSVDQIFRSGTARVSRRFSCPQRRDQQGDRRRLPVFRHEDGPMSRMRLAIRHTTHYSFGSPVLHRAPAG